MEWVQKILEDCEHWQGFQISQSLGGGTRSGLGSNILVRLKDEYPGKILHTYSVLPSPNVSANLLEPYKVYFALSKLAGNSDISTIIHNVAPFKVC